MSVTVEERAQPAGSVRDRSVVFGRGAAIVLGLTVLAAVVRFWHIGHQGFWFDEANTAELVHFTPGAMLRQLPRTESTPPLYYCVTWVWARVFGYTEAPLRALSAVLGAATVPVAYAIGSRLVSRRAGVIAAALTTCSPILIWYSQEARSYALLVFLSSLSLLTFAYAREAPTPRRMTLWAISAVLALLTHYYALLAVVPEAVWLLGRHRRVRAAQIGVALVGLCGAGLVPLALSQNATSGTAWISAHALGRRLGQVIPQFAISFEGPAHGVLEPVAIAVLILTVILLATRSLEAERRGALVAGSLALAGLMLNLGLVAVGVDDLLSRNLFAVWMAAAVFVAGGLAASRAQVLGLLATAVLCGAGLATAAGMALDRRYQRPDWRPVATVLGHRSAAPRAILIQHYLDRLPLSLYMPGLKFMPRHGAPVSELDVISFTAPPASGFCWWGSACNLRPSAMQASYPIPGFHEVSRRRVLQFTILKLVADHPRRLTLRGLQPALTATSYRDDKLFYQR